MTTPPTAAAGLNRAALVPELLVSDITKSLWFWRNLCGFAVTYERLYEGFVSLDLGGAQVMLEERGRGRNWIAGALEVPFGRGMNLEIQVPSIEPVLGSLRNAGWPLFMEPEEKWYRAGETETGARQFLVQDPDGYLLRFSARLGERSLSR